MSKAMQAIGMMSGTSMDGIDVAMIETDGEGIVRRGPGATFAYDRAFRSRLGQAIADARAVTNRAERSGCLADVEAEITVRHADALADFMAREGLERSAIDIVGFHGQTVLHRPEDRLTLQLGDGPTLARLTGLKVAYDMRAEDVAEGGQGAPLASVYHRAMAAACDDRPVAVLNIGGVANVTWIGRDDQLLAFDTGPGNALIDDWMAKRIGASRDDGGAAALAGKAQTATVKFFLDHAYFAAAPPKSLDRNTFFWDLVDGLSVEDGAATLTAMTVGAVAQARTHMPEPPKRWVVCGGGRRNGAIMAGLQDVLAVPVIPAEDIGFDGDTVEAEAWAYLAVRALKGLPLTYPGTTGVRAPQTGGCIIA
ncbi:MAG: anhydro-N-acetylmuramic acid kinase [Pseudomonadota bacterium]